MKSKRYICAMVVSVAIMLSGCGGSNNVQSSAQQGGLQPSQSEEQSATTEPVRTVKAADVFDVVTGISKEWQDGLYVINGKDSDGTMICGIMDKDQNVRIYEDYTALYPLADGHLIATQDTDMSGECYFEGIKVPIGFAGIHGVIIDANGNIVYEPKNDEYSRMYVINSHLILQLNAKMDFDGTEISANVIDQNGEVLYEDEKIPQMLSMYGYVKFSEDGKTWTLSQHAPRKLIVGSEPLDFIQRGISDKYGESPLFRMEWGSISGERSFYGYGLVSEDGLEFNSVPLDEWAESDPSTDWVKFFDSQSFIDQRGQIISTDSNQNDSKKPDLSAIQQFIEDEKGKFNYRIIYMGLIEEENRQKPYFLVRPIQTLNGEKVVDADKNVIAISQKYIDSMTGYKIVGTKIILFMENDGSRNFCTILNADGSVYKEPFLTVEQVSGLNTKRVAMKDELLAYVADHADNNVVMVDIDTGNQVADIVLENPESTIADIWFMEDYLMVRYEDGTETANYLYHVYDLKGNQIL